jgi:hypothetical protein
MMSCRNKGNVIFFGNRWDLLGYFPCDKTICINVDGVFNIALCPACAPCNKNMKNKNIVIALLMFSSLMACTPKETHNIVKETHVNAYQQPYSGKK